jgi:hypothetical protein
MNLSGPRSIFGSFFHNSFDTAVVLAFLGLELGRTLGSFGFDGFLLLVTMVPVGVLTYYLPTTSDRPPLAKWLIKRGVLGIFAITAGVALSADDGRLLPGYFRFVPLFLLIFASIASCFIQFYALMRLRLAK